MKSRTMIALDDDWQYFFTQDDQIDYSSIRVNESLWIPLAQLSDWVLTSTTQSGVDWFSREFILNPADDCVNYVLHIEQIAGMVCVYVNDQEIAVTTSKQSFAVDVTNYVALGVNKIILQVTSHADMGGGSFGKIYLESIPCDDGF